MRKLVIVLALVFVVALALPALAGNTDDPDVKLSGPHYNLNIIGVPKDKKDKVNMTNSNRHTIFVPLDKSGTKAATNIYLIPTTTENAEAGKYFQVCDGNGFDEARDCNGDPLGGGKNGATFMLPCNTAIDVDVPCDLGDSNLDYSIWIRRVGTPGDGTGHLTLCGTYKGVDYCNSGENIVNLSRNNPPKFMNVTAQLTTLYDTVDGKVALFAPNSEDWYWAYDANGTKLAQLRFYPE